jgi:hypothetical protein
MWANGAARVRTVGNVLDQYLDGARCQAQGVMQRKVSLQQGLDARREGNDPAFGLGPIRPTLAIDHEAVALPVNILFFQLREFRDPEPGIKQRPDDELLGVRLAGVRQSSGFVLGQGFAFELVGHGSILSFSISYLVISL